MNNSPNFERKVGVFVFIGIVVTCAMILHFGKVGDRFRGGFPITVEFSNTGGLIPWAQVHYSGVLVGKVDEIRLNKEKGNVEVGINMFNDVGIRKDSKFMIKQSGLLGDQHIVIAPGSPSAPPLEAGDTVTGLDPFDFSEIATQAGDALKKLNTAIDRLSSDVLAADTLENVKKGIKNLADLGNKLSSNSEKLNSLLTDLQKGKGTVGKLLTDDALFQELKRLIHNWRVYGLLHREKSEERYPTPGNRKSAYPGGGYPGE
jgi:phospholipid/cholesterol/gamma-HCH transport system substrate-binding protein